jgi:uncharacterized membrane protein YgcG
MNEMNSITNTMNSTQQAQLAAYEVAINNDSQATTNRGLQDTTLDVLGSQLDNSAYNIGIVQQDDVNKARMADININQSKEYDAQMELFKMMSFYLVIILFFGVLGKFVPMIANITKLMCVFITLVMLYHVYGKMVDMYHRSSTNYDEYDFSKPKYTAATGPDDDDDDDDDDGCPTSSSTTFGVTSSGSSGSSGSSFGTKSSFGSKISESFTNNFGSKTTESLTSNFGSKTAESFTTIKPYNSKTKSLLSKSKF